MPTPMSGQLLRFFIVSLLVPALLIDPSLAASFTSPGPSTPAWATCRTTLSEQGLSAQIENVLRPLLPNGVERHEQVGIARRSLRSESLWQSVSFFLLSNNVPDLNTNAPDEPISKWVPIFFSIAAGGLWLIVGYVFWERYKLRREQRWAHQADAGPYRRELAEPPEPLTPAQSSSSSEPKTVAEWLEKHASITFTGDDEVRQEVEEVWLRSPGSKLMGTEAETLVRLLLQERGFDSWDETWSGRTYYLSRSGKRVVLVAYRGSFREGAPEWIITRTQALDLGHDLRLARIPFEIDLLDNEKGFRVRVLDETAPSGVATYAIDENGEISRDGKPVSTAPTETIHSKHTPHADALSEAA